MVVSKMKRVNRVGLVIKGKGALVKGAVWIGMRKRAREEIEKREGERERERQRLAWSDK